MSDWGEGFANGVIVCVVAWAIWRTLAWIWKIHRMSDEEFASYRGIIIDKPKTKLPDPPPAPPRPPGMTSHPPPRKS